MSTWFGSDVWPPARRARLRLVITLLCVIAAAVAISLAMFRSFLLPPDADTQLDEYLREQDERRLEGVKPTEERFPGDPAREAPGGP